MGPPLQKIVNLNLDTVSDQKQLLVTGEGASWAPKIRRRDRSTLGNGLQQQRGRAVVTLVDPDRARILSPRSRQRCQTGLRYPAFSAPPRCEGARNVGGALPREACKSPQ